MKPGINKSATAFTLIEVMIALGIFFMAIFTILGVISSGLKNARSFQGKIINAGMVIPLVVTNEEMTEGSDQLDTSDLEKIYPGYKWNNDTSEVMSNHLKEVDIVMGKEFGKGGVDTMSLLRWTPNSKPGSMDGGLGGPP